MNHLSSKTLVPAIGTPMEGGYFAGLYLENGAPMALIVAPKAEGETEVSKWGPSEKTGARSLIDGLANSEAINDDAHPAAKFCRDLRIGGFDDWHLPALDQMTVLRANLTPEDDHVPEQTTAEAFKLDGPEAFEVDDCYLTSTEWGSGSVWLQYFSDGGQGGDGKDWSGLVRAVRKVPFNL